MKKFILKFLLITAISALIISVYCQLASAASLKYNGINTETQIKTSFENAVKGGYDCYFLGNSRIYRDINPEMFTSVRSFNFGHDNDSYNQMYYKLLYLLNNNISIRYLIIGTDYFQFSVLSDSRNYVYSSLFPKEYSDDYGDSDWISIAENYCTGIWTNKQNSLPALFKMVLNRNAPSAVNYLKENGQYVCSGNADPNDSIIRDYSISDIQLKYFREIISECQKTNIELYVIMPPLWEGEMINHTDEERSAFDDMIHKELDNTPFRDNYINYYNEKGLSSYLDFIDVTHLKPEAADSYSSYINERIFNACS